MIERAEDYPWSGARAHCGIQVDNLLDQGFPPPGLIPDWSAWLKPELSARDLEEIRTATWKGIPYASKAFIQELETLLGFRILPGKKGRPAKKGD